MLPGLSAASDGILARTGPLLHSGAGRCRSREVARLLVAAWLGLRLRAILLLPIGGLFAYANPESQENANQGSRPVRPRLRRPHRQRRRPALVLAATFLGAGGNFNLFEPALDHRPRTCCAAWSGCRPASALCICCPPIRSTSDACCAAASPASTASPLPAAPPPASASCCALAAMVGGMLLHSPWLIIAGFFIMIGAQVEDQGVFFQSVVDTVRMREVMLTDFATLSPSDTLADALVRCVHSLQEDFPVVRGPQLVGIVSRQRIVDALRNDGNGYVQSVMSRAFQVARPEDTLGTTIRRITAGRGLSLIPVTESGRVVGIVSVQNLMSSMSLLAEQRRIERD